MKIAHFGAFDTGGYGELLSSLVLRSRLSDLYDELVDVSPSGRGPLHPEPPEGMSIEAFLDDPSRTDAVILGRGAFRPPPEAARSVDPADVYGSLARSNAWLAPAYMAARDGLPLCWNAPDIPEGLSSVSARLLGWAASASGYASVGSAGDRRLLEGYGVTGVAAAHPALDAPAVWEARELEEAYSEAYSSRGGERPERALVLDLSGLGREEPEALAPVLDGLCERAGATAVLVDLEDLYGRGSGESVRRLAGGMRTAPLPLDEPRGLREVVACISRSEAYMGPSASGLMTAVAFGKRGLPVAAAEPPEHPALSGWSAASWEEAAGLGEKLLAAPAGGWEDLRAEPALREHWERMRRALLAGRTDESGRERRLAGLKEVGERYLGEDASLGGAAVERLLEAEAEISRLRRRNAELQGGSAALERWMRSVDEQVPALLGSRQWRAGRLLHELHRRVTRGPRVPTAAAYLVNTLQQYRSYRDGAAAQPVQIPEGGLETRARRLLELAESNRSLPSALRSVSGRAAAAGRRKARLQYRRLKPRIGRDELAGRIRQRLGAAPRLADWPTVSIIVLNRDGLSYLRKLLAGLTDHTDYPAAKLELILVDNASTDGSAEFVRSFEAPFEIRTVENPENVSFSEGNNRGAELATGELLLFLNNDIEPFESGWLSEMVALWRERGSGGNAGAVGARLVYPGVTEHDAPNARAASGYALQHRGVGFRKAAGEEWHRNLGAGEDALDPRLGVDEDRPAVTAACALVEKGAFESVGGFTPGYRYGSEDVDLCLKLLTGGYGVVSSGRAVLLHDESPSQKAAGREFMRTNRASNRRMFFERWGPELLRRCRLERLSGDGNGYWTFEAAPHIALTVTSKDPRDGYGDWHTAHEMGGALEAAGWRVTYVERKGDRWYDLPADLDYLLVLVDLYDVSKVPRGVTTVAWVRNWTERWTEHPWFEDYDVVLASSGISRRIIEERTAKSVDALFPIAANPERFSRTAPEVTYEADYVFTGNFWGELRGVVDALDVGSGETFRIYGKGWENVPSVARYAQGSVPYDELAKVYSSAKLVVDDTASPTLPYGAVNSRVFDALAAGTLPVTNCEPGVRELFDEDFPTYSGRESLRAQLDALLADDARREELAGRYRSVVLAEHTYAKRAEQLGEILRRRAGAMSFCIKIGAPNRKEAESWGDTHYARAMRRQLEAAGHPCAIQTLEEWDDLEGMKYDVAIHLKGLTPYTTKPGQLNVLWNISHPEKLTARECDKYDLVFTASQRWAERLSAETERPVVFLEQATDPEVFYPDHDDAHGRDLVFVGNSRRVERRILKDLLPTKHDLAVWGGDWEGIIDRRYVVGEYLPNDEVRKAYSSAAIVLNDHWDDMREHGFISNRVYDALACGALVISDRIEELDEEFGEAVVTYEGADELRELVDYYLSHPEERRARGERGRELVLQSHTFQKRVGRMTEAVSGLQRPVPELPAEHGTQAVTGIS